MIQFSVVFPSALHLIESSTFDLKDVDCDTTDLKAMDSDSGMIMDIRMELVIGKTRL